MPWLELIGVILLAVGGCLLGRRVGRTRRWWPGFVLPLLIVVVVFLGHRSVALSFVPPISWAVNADVNPLLMSLAATVMLSTLIAKLPAPRRFMPSLLMWVMVIYYGVLPIALPLAARPSLAATPTQIERRGVCIQAHGYSCGPAAAVTCLRALGVPAEEGPLAIEARCGPLVGADGNLLARAITRLYGEAGIRGEYRRIASPDDLTLPAVANMSLPRIGGHYLAVLEVRRDDVIVGDPLSGPYAMTRADFLAGYQGAALVFLRDAQPKGARQTASR